VRFFYEVFIETKAGKKGRKKNLQKHQIFNTFAQDYTRQAKFSPSYLTSFYIITNYILKH